MITEKMSRIAALCILSSAFALEHHQQPIEWVAMIMMKMTTMMTTTTIMMMMMILIIVSACSGRLRRVGRIEDDEVAVVKAQVGDHHHNM